MDEYINIDDKKPKDGQLVRIVTRSSYSRDTSGEVTYTNARFKVLTENSSVMNSGLFDGELFLFNGEDNLTYGARQVLYWAPIKETEPEGLKTNPRYIQICECNQINKDRWDKMWQEYNETPQAKANKKQAEDSLIHAMCTLGKHN